MALPFLKLMKNSTTLQLMKFPKAFTLLCFIAQRTNITSEDCLINGLEIGEAPIGDHENCGLSRAEYRAAIKRLTNSQLTTIKTTNRGTIAKLINKTIIDLNLEGNDQQKTKSVPKHDQETTTTKELRIKNKELLKEINKEKERERATNPYYEAFKGVCVTRGIACDVMEERFLELREEYFLRLNWWEQSKACVDWCYDKGLKKINIQRLRNWMRNAVKFQKEKDIKQKQEFQDKKFIQLPIIKSAKEIPLWQPPL